MPARPTHGLLLIFPGGGPQALPRPRLTPAWSWEGAGPTRAASPGGDEASGPPTGGDLPVEEGGEEAAQENLVFHPRAQVAVHQLPTRDVDAGACGRRTQRDREALKPRPGAAGPRAGGLQVRGEAGGR